MPIPSFNHNEVLPPHLGDPRELAHLSPYPTTSEEVCQRFSTSANRRNILTGWLNFRARMTGLGIVAGFQWLDGSFLENVEATESRDPNDLDIVTFFQLPAVPDLVAYQQRVLAEFPEFVDHNLSKANFQLDHFPVHLGAPSFALVEHTRYWSGLFAHRRDGVWKGMLRVELNTPIDDNKAVEILRAKDEPEPNKGVPKQPTS